MRKAEVRVQGSELSRQACNAHPARFDNDKAAAQSFFSKERNFSHFGSKVMPQPGGVTNENHSGSGSPVGINEITKILVFSDENAVVVHGEGDNAGVFRSLCELTNREHIMSGISERKHHSEVTALVG